MKLDRIRLSKEIWKEKWNKNQRNKYTTLLNSLREKRIKKSIIEKSDDPKGMFREFKNAQYKQVDTPLPKLEPGEKPPDALNDFFLEKTNKLRVDLVVFHQVQALAVVYPLVCIGHF